MILCHLPLPKKSKRKTGVLNLVGFRRTSFRREVSSGANRPVEAMIWINEIESAKSIVELSKNNHRGRVADKLQGSCLEDGKRPPEHHQRRP